MSIKDQYGCKHLVLEIIKSNWCCEGCLQPAVSGVRTCQCKNTLLVALPMGELPWAICKCEDCGVLLPGLGNTSNVTRRAGYRAYYYICRMSNKNPKAQRYTLDEKNMPKECDSPYLWARWFQTATNRVVATDELDDMEVSTFFVGLDPDPREKPIMTTIGETPKMLFETMIFGGKKHNQRWRYSSWNEAKAGHEKVMAELRNEHSHLHDVRAISLE